MKIKNIFSAVFAAVLVLAFISSAASQTQLMIKRTTSKSDSLEFGAGGTLSIIGAPAGSIRIEGWNENRIQIDAEIEINAPDEQSLNELSKLTGFIMEESLGKTAITSLGTHDKSYMKKAAKKFPKRLLGLPFRIDYVIKVPRYCDLQIDGGKGDLYIGGVDGTMKVNFIEAKAKLDLVGGGVFATFGGGTVEVTVPDRSWRGRFADIQLAAGAMSVGLPPSLNAELDASILRTGAIENTYANLKPRTRRDAFTEKMVAAKSGSGGVPLKFTVGDGTMKIFQTGKL